MEDTRIIEVKKRYTVPDVIRGVAIIAMIFYHTMWDLTRVFGVTAPWFASDTMRVIQLLIRWSFILLSGFCVRMGKRKYYRALTVLASSAIISGVTAIFMSGNTIIHGVLSLIGVAMLITAALDKYLCRIPPEIGIGVSAVLFLFFQHTSMGYLGFFSARLIELPQLLYANVITAFLGFPHEGFYSPDFVPFLPWFFSFLIGYFLFCLFEKYKLLKFLSAFSFKPLELLGRHSLEIYLLHQPVVYGILYFIFKIL